MDNLLIRGNIFKVRCMSGCMGGGVELQSGKCIRWTCNQFNVATVVINYLAHFLACYTECQTLQYFLVGFCLFSNLPGIHIKHIKGRACKVNPINLTSRGNTSSVVFQLFNCSLKQSSYNNPQIVPHCCLLDCWATLLTWHSGCKRFPSHDGTSDFVW